MLTHRMSYLHQSNFAVAALAWLLHRYVFLGLINCGSLLGLGSRLTYNTALVLERGSYRFYLYPRYPLHLIRAGIREEESSA